MKRLLNVAGGLLSLLALTVLVIALVLAFGGLQGGTGQPSQTAQPSVQVPTSPPYPPPGTPTAVPTPRPGIRAEKLRIEKEVQLTFEGPNSIFPNISWSPQSNAILASKPNGQTIKTATTTYLLGDLWLIPLDSTVPRKLAANADWGKWSRGGQWIAYGSLIGPATQEVHIMRDDGSDALKVTTADRSSVDWLSSDEIVYVKDSQLWVVGLQGKNPQAVFPAVSLDSSQDDTFLLSPTGLQLAYLRRSTLTLIGVNGTEPIELTSKLDSNHGNRPDLAWSPNDQRLAYIELGASAPQLQVINVKDMRVNTVYTAEGSHLRRPSWLSSSRVIFFSRYPTGTETFACCAKIFAINDDGTGLNDLTGDRAPQQYPEVSPDGTKIAFFREGDLWVAFLSIEP